MNNTVTGGKYTNFTIEDIQAYLDELFRLIDQGSYTISQNRKRTENIDFMQTYRLDSKKSETILRSLTPYNFCYAADNHKPEFAHEKLYIFCKKCTLDNWGEEELVDVYIKTNLTQSRNGDKSVIVISFHKRNKPITFCFAK